MPTAPRMQKRGHTHHTDACRHEIYDPPGWLRRDGAEKSNRTVVADNWL